MRKTDSRFRWISQTCRMEKQVHSFFFFANPFGNVCLTGPSIYVPGICFLRSTERFVCQLDLSLNKVQNTEIRPAAGTLFVNVQSFDETVLSEWKIVYLCGIDQIVTKIWKFCDVNCRLPFVAQMTPSRFQLFHRVADSLIVCLVDSAARPRISFRFVSLPYLMARR